MVLKSSTSSRVLRRELVLGARASPVRKKILRSINEKLYVAKQLRKEGVRLRGNPSVSQEYIESLAVGLERKAKARRNLLRRQRGK